MRDNETTVLSYGTRLLCPEANPKKRFRSLNFIDTKCPSPPAASRSLRAAAMRSSSRLRIEKVLCTTKLENRSA